MKQKYKGVLLEPIYIPIKKRKVFFTSCSGAYVWRIYWADGTIRQTLTRAAARRVITRELSQARS